MRSVAITGFVVAVVSCSSVWAENVPLSGAQNFLGAPFSQPREIAVGDIDGDGDLDAVIQSQQTGVVAWLENTGGDASTWTQRAIDLVVTNPMDPGFPNEGFGDTTFLTLADVDQTGSLDVVVTRLNNTINGEAIVWYENDGTPANDAEWVKHPIGLNLALPVGCAVADIDRDGDPDVVLAHTSVGTSAAGDEILWFENTGAKGVSWPSHVIDAATEEPFIVAVGDINGDGWVDVASVALTDNQIVWYANDQDPRNSAFWVEQVVQANFTRARNLAIRDMNRDGFLDIIACARGTSVPAVPGEVAWWQGDGGTTWTKRPISSAVNEAASLTVGDFDIDGDIDVFVGTDNASTVGVDDSITWFENLNGAGTSWTARPIESGTVDRVVSLALGDLDGDGDLELSASIFGTNNLRWYENQLQHRSAGFATATSVETTLTQFRSVAAADVDGDGRPDAVGVSEAGNTVAWWENGGTGTTWTKTNIDTAFTAPVAVGAADIDGDGTVDVVAASGSTNTVALWRNTDGAGTTWAESTVDSAVAGARALAIADIDRDSYLDLVVCGTGGAVNWFENRLDLNEGWTSHSVATGLTGAASVAIGDVNGDGVPDIGVAAQTLGAVRWFENDGTPGNPGSFTPRVVDNGAVDAAAVAFADIDRDGDLDVLAGRPGSGTTTAYLNANGIGTSWTPTALMAGGVATMGLVSRDFDRDGDGDAFAAGSSSNASTYIAVTLPGAGTSAIATAPGLTNPRGLASADFNGDGFSDVLLGANNGIRALLNEKGYFSVSGTALDIEGDPEGATVAALELDVEHGGTSGDGNLDWRTLRVLFTTTTGTALTTPQANALIDAVDLYLDNGNGTFEMGADTLVVGASPLALTAGVQELSISDGDPDGLLIPGTPRRYFIVLTLAGDAGSQDPKFFLTTVLGSGGTAEESGTNTVRAQAGTVAVASRALLPGRDPADVNFDGNVNAVDVQLVINAALGLEIGDFDSDINDDGQTNAVDVQLVINAALGL